MDKEENFIPRIGRLIENYIVAYSREVVDDFKNEVKQNVYTKLKLVSAIIVIGLGMIFVMIGIAMALSQFLDAAGSGQLIVGALTIIVGIILVEITKSKFNHK